MDLTRLFISYVFCINDVGTISGVGILLCKQYTGNGSLNTIIFLLLIIGNV
jgi:hypothetical protein